MMAATGLGSVAGDHIASVAGSAMRATPPAAECPIGTGVAVGVKVGVAVAVGVSVAVGVADGGLALYTFLPRKKREPDAPDSLPSA